MTEEAALEKFLAPLRNKPDLWPTVTLPDWAEAFINQQMAIAAEKLPINEPQEIIPLSSPSNLHEKRLALLRSLTAPNTSQIEEIAQLERSIENDMRAIYAAAQPDADRKCANAVDELEEALRFALKAMEMGPLELAAEYGPNAHPDEALVDAAFRIKKVLKNDRT